MSFFNSSNQIIKTVCKFAISPSKIYRGYKGSSRYWTETYMKKLHRKLITESERSWPLQYSRHTSLTMKPISHWCNPSATTSLRCFNQCPLPLRMHIKHLHGIHCRRWVLLLLRMSDLQLSRFFLQCISTVGTLILLVYGHSQIWLQFLFWCPQL